MLRPVWELSQVDGSNLFFDVVTEGVKDCGEFLIAKNVPGPLFVLVLHYSIILMLSIKQCLWIDFYC